MPKNNPRSQSYQYKILEVPFDFTIPVPWSEEDALNVSNSEDYHNTLAELHTAIVELVNKHGTKRQKQVFNLHQQGLTQVEIGKTLDCNQSSVTKSLQGNTTYKKGTPNKSYGGLFKKLRRLVAADPKLQQLRQQLGYLAASPSNSIYNFASGSEATGQPSAIESPPEAPKGRPRLQAPSCKVCKQTHPSAFTRNNWSTCVPCIAARNQASYRAKRGNGFTIRLLPDVLEKLKPLATKQQISIPELCVNLICAQLEKL